MEYEYHGSKTLDEPVSPRDIEEQTRFIMEGDTFSAHAGVLLSESAVYRDGERVRELENSEECLLPIIVFTDGEFTEDEHVIERMNEKTVDTADEIAQKYEEADDKEEMLRSVDMPRFVEKE